MSAPICLIENPRNATFAVNPEAIKILARIEQPVVVASIVGLYRTGKSYLMNKLAGVSSGFPLGSSIEAKTKGIWMWCVPHPTRYKHTLVLLDTEGLGDAKKGDNNNDIKIFTMAVLLSSALVYNSKGVIDQDGLNKLKLVGEISEYIKVKSHSNGNEDLELSKHFPIFIWAVRDFHLELKNGENRITEDQYLESVLEPKSSAKQDEEYNNLRSRLRMYFGSRKCFVFEQPTSKTDDLNNLDKVHDSELSATFVTQTQKFSEYIFSNAKVKTINDITEVTGCRLGELAKMYVKSINTSNFVCMEKTVVSLAEKENRRAVDEGVKYYVKTMQNIVLPTETLQQFLNLSKGIEVDAQNKFLKRSFKDEKHLFLEEYLETISLKRIEFSNMNEQKSQKKCEVLIRKHSKPLDKALDAQAYCRTGGHAIYKQQLHAVVERYTQEPGKGVKADTVLQMYLKSKQEIEVMILNMDNTLTQRERERQEENTREILRQKEERLQREKYAKETQHLQHMNSFLETSVQQIKQNMEEERRAMDKKLEELIKKKEQERRLFVNQQVHKQAETCQQQIDQMRREKDIAVKKLTKQLKDLEQARVEALREKKGKCTIS